LEHNFGIILLLNIAIYSNEKLCLSFLIYYIFFPKKIIVTKFKNFFLRPDLKNFYGHSFFSKCILFFFPKSISEFQKWTFINVQK
jgi:hypothetical protein